MLEPEGLSSSNRTMIRFESTDTNGNGLFVYDNISKKVKRYYDNNSALNSNYIYNIVPSLLNSILISTEKGISRYNIEDRQFKNWSSDQLTGFNPLSGIKSSDGDYYFGSNKGVINFTNDALSSEINKTKLIFNSLYINYQKVYPDEEDSPLTSNIDNTDILHLDNDQNTFTIELASINFDSQ